jgi:uncharacterized protein YdaU (DUF1376 family)
MMSEKSEKGSANLSMPYYPLFHRDFHFDTMLWPLDAVGAMIRLMNWQWERGFLPGNQKQLAQICQCQDSEQWSRLWIDYLSEKFPEAEPGKLRNDRLHREYVRICDRNAKAKAAADKRWSDRTSHTETETETETDTNSSPSGRVAVPHQKIVDLYHEHCPALPRVKVINSKRQAALRARWKTFSVEVKGKERHFNDLKTWERYFKFITNNCPFLLGNNERNWVANFDFCIRETAMVGVFENKYVDRK